MGSRFLETDTGKVDLKELANGSFDIDAKSLTAQNLIPNLTLKTNSDRKIISASLLISDINTLQTNLDTKTKLNFTNTATPSNPPSNNISLYAKNNKLYYLNSVGTEIEITDPTAVTVGWNFSTLITGNVISGDVRFNNVTPASVTEICVSQINSNGNNQRALILSLVDGDQFYITDNINNSKLYTLTGDITDNTTWFCLPVVLENQNVATNYSDNDLVSITFIQQVTNLQSSYDVSSSPQIITSTSEGPLIIKNGQADDNNKKQFQVKNSADVNILTVNSNNIISGKDLIIQQDGSSNYGQLTVGDGSSFNIRSNGVPLFLSTTGDDIKIFSALDINSKVLKNLVDPTNAQDAATKNYVDTKTSNIRTPATDNIIVSGDALSGQSIVAGDNNTIVGSNVGTLLVAESNNTLMGKSCGEKLQSGSNSMYGQTAGKNLTSGLNDCFGVACMRSITGQANSADKNSAFGRNSLKNIVSGNNNIAMGFKSGEIINTGNNNSILGFQAATSLTSGGFNSILGANSSTTLTGSYNTCIGTSSGLNLAAANINTCVGYESGRSLITGTNCTLLGANAGVSSLNTDLKYGIALGDFATCTFDFEFKIGSAVAGNNITQINPGITNTCDIGSLVRKFKDIHLAGNIKADNVSVDLGGSPTQGQILKATSSSNASWQEKISVNTAATGLSLTPNTIYDQEELTNLTGNSFTIANPSGIAVNGKKMTLRITKDSVQNAQVFYGSIYRSIGITLPTTLNVSKTMYVGIIYNSTAVKWDIVSVALQT